MSKILEKLKASLADCPACSEDDLDLMTPLSEDEIAEYAAMHGLRARGLTDKEARADLSDEEIRVLADAAERVRSSGRSQFLRPERLAAERAALEELERETRGRIPPAGTWCTA